MNSNPIFITGPDRSGTSLMFALLASHPNIAMVRRTNMWRWFYRQHGDLSDPANFEQCLTALLRYKRLEHLSPEPERIRREFWQGEPTYGRLFALFHQHHAERAGKSRWGDKSLHTEHYADEVFTEFPNARMIHMIRDPRDRYASVLKRYDGATRGIPSTTGRWLASTRAAKRNLQAYPGQYLAINYETLASQPEATLQQVCAFIGESYTPAMLLMQGAPEHQAGNSSFGQFEPGVISTRSIGRYRQVLTQRQIGLIQTYAGADMTTFNYELEPVHLTPGQRLKFYAVDVPLSAARLAGWVATDKLAELKGKSAPAHRLLDVEQAQTLSGA